MLAAVTQVDRQLAMVRLILDLVATNVDVPDSLKQHLVDVITQAVRLSGNEGVHGPTSGEAVELALDLRGDDLAGELRQVTDFRSINPDLARRLLTRLQHTAA